MLQPFSVDGVCCSDISFKSKAIMRVELHLYAQVSDIEALMEAIVSSYWFSDSRVGVFGRTGCENKKRFPEL